MENSEFSNEIVYHYCGINAFINIVQHSKIWLSDVFKSNDSQELLWAMENVKKEILQMIGDEGTLKSLDMGFNLLNPIENVGLTSYFISCFSEEEDLLSQWCKYAEDGQGIAIGFSKDLLLKLNSICHGLSFRKVVYSRKEQEIVFKKVAMENLKKMSSKRAAHVALELAQNYAEEFLLCKNPSFDEEIEWRIVFTSEAGRKVNFNECGYKIQNPNIRVSKGNIVAFYELDFSDIKQDIIKSIVVGPKSKVTKTDLVKLLFTCGYYDNQFNTETPINISFSKSSYR